LWVLPQATWFPVITRLRNIAEHACIARGEPDPLRQARTTRAGWIARSALAPYWVNYHCEHHLFTNLPCWNLPVAHAILSQRGTTANMEIQPNYLTLLRLATATSTHHAAVI
jgi:fatty acid desaturase